MQGEWRKCRVSGKEFSISASDFEFYDKMGVPAPTLCPEERARRRLSWRNERKLYYRKCDLCQKKIVSMYRNDLKFPVYCKECWWGDEWNALDYGQEFDSTRSFFEQINELQQKVPALALWNYASENAEFNNCSFNNKNCYMNFTTDKSEDCYYNTSSDSCKDVMDSYEARSCELCYECIDCMNCFNSKYLQNCKNCNDSVFLKNCIGCSSCFGSVNLRNKEYWFFNEKCTKEEYEQKMSEVRLDSHIHLQRLKDSIQQFLLKFPHKYAEFENCENCTGNYIRNSKNTKESFDVQDAFDVKYCTYVTFEPVENTMDAYAVGGIKNCYEVMAGPNMNDSSFIIGINNGPHKSKYCMSCVNNCNELFGCVGMKHAKYCILNKQYTKEEYEDLVPKIIEHMRKFGEYGEFFPAKFSPFGYNETLAQEYFFMSKDEVISKGWKWTEEQETFQNNESATEIPDLISNVDDDILKEILKCDTCNKKYKVIEKELMFYRKAEISIPRNCPNCRHEERVKHRNPRELFDRKCDKCDKEICSSFSSERIEKVYCEECYLENVI